MRMRWSRAGGAPTGRRVLRMALIAGLVVLLGAAVTALGGCGGVEIGTTQEVVVDEPLGAAALTDVELRMGAGSLLIAPGAIGLASGTIVCNVEPWIPTVVRTDKSLKITQETKKSVVGLPNDIVNRWELALGKAPMRLNISAGAYEGELNLSGLTLQELTIKDGAARNKVRFDTVNPSQMSRFLYETGASTVSLAGLANANFQSMTFTGGAGTYSFDFSGQLRTAATVRISAGAATVRIEVPPVTAARVTVTGKLNDVKTEGMWTTSGDTYSTTGAGSAAQGRMLAITVDVNVGSVTLVSK